MKNASHFIYLDGINSKLYLCNLSGKQIDGVRIKINSYDFPDFIDLTFSYNLGIC